MLHLLRIDASSRQSGSHSRLLGDQIVTRLQQQHPGLVLTHRDLGINPLPHITATTIQGYYTAEADLNTDLRQAIAGSDQVIHEVAQADVLLICTPMYNFGLPSALKAWFDHLVRIHKTVAYDGTTFSGKLGGRKAVLAVCSGASGFESGGALAAGDFVTPYLRFTLEFLGIEVISCLHLQGTNGDPQQLAQNWQSINNDIAALPARL